MAKMTIREKIAQLIMMDFRTWDNQNFTKMNESVEKLIRTYDFGGIILFKENLENNSQIHQLTSAMQNSASKSKHKIPLLISTDQEGGIVHRINSGCAMPGNMAIGATHNARYAKKAGEVIGEELKALGINTNFAPCVDVNVNPNNPVIGLRSFSDDPQLVYQCANQFIDGLHENDVLSTIKHYPGHGDTSIDSHTGLPVINKSKEQLKSDLFPFMKLSSKTDMVMSAHISYPLIDDSKMGSIYTPATFSSKMNKILREEFNFKGVIVTDALNMGAISKYFTPKEAVIHSLNAGADLLLMPIIVHGDQDVKLLNNMMDELEKAVEKGDVSLNRIDEAVKRVLTLKNKIKKNNMTQEEANTIVGSKEHHKIESDISKASFTVIKNKKDVLPLSNSKKLLVAYPYKNEKPAVELAIRRMKKDLQVDYLLYGEDTTENEIRTKVGYYDTVLCISEIINTKHLKSSHYMTRVPTQMMQATFSQKKIGIIMSIANPNDVANYKEADAIVAVYGNTGMDPTESLMPEKAYGPNIVAGVEMLFGYRKQLGKLPVNIYSYDDNKEEFTSKIVYKRGYGLSYKEEIKMNNPKRPVILFIVMTVASLSLIGIYLFIKRRIQWQS